MILPYESHDIQCATNKILTDVNFANQGTDNVGETKFALTVREAKYFHGLSDHNLTKLNYNIN